MRLISEKVLCIMCIMMLLFVNFTICSADKESVDFKKGDIIQLGSYNGEPILWYVLYKDGQDNVVVISRNILTIKPFDAAGDTNEKDEFYSYAYYYGSNKWADSSLRMWLNSNEKYIKWHNNDPNEMQSFGGENAYDQEAGFLHKTNFNSGELEAILPTQYKSTGGETFNDKVILMSSDEYKDLLNDNEIYPIQIATLSAIMKSEYKSPDLKSGKQYPIWTRDSADNPYATHAVKVITTHGDEIAAPASSGRYGVMPMMTLDQQLLKGHLIKGNGDSGNPYLFDLSTMLTFPKHFIAVFLLVLLVSVLLLRLKWANYVKKGSLAILVISVLLIPGYHSYGLQDHLTLSNYVIIRSDAQQKDLIFKRMEMIQKSNWLFIIDEQGRDVSETVDLRRLGNMTIEQKEDFLKYLEKNNYYLLNGGDFRVANFASEIDGVYNGEHYIVPLKYAEIGYEKAIDLTLNKTFKDENRKYFEAHDYDEIKAYLEKNNLTVRHPSDTSGIGIPSLNWEFYLSNDVMTNNENDFSWKNAIKPTRSEITVEEKDKLYIDAMSNAIENSIIQSYDDLKGVAVEIQKEDDSVSILVILDVDTQNEIRSSDIEEIELFVLSTVFEGSEQHLKIVNQDGKRLD